MSDAAYTAIAHKIGALVAHPFADLFPMLPAAELAELADSIKRDGLLEKIIIYGDTILDGRNRYAALAVAGIPYDRSHFKFFAGSEQEAGELVESLNINRRHLSVAQRAMAAAAFRKMRGLSLDQVLDMTGLSKGSLIRAQKIRDEAPKNIQRMITRGEIGMAQIEEALKRGDVSKLKGMKSAEQVKEELKRQGIKSYNNRSPTRCIKDLAELMTDLQARDPADLIAYRVEIDTAVQQLLTVAEAVASARRDEAQVA
jgi:ParB-like chromosome segregation protein Spo0J